MGSIPNKQVKIKYIFKKTATDFSVAVKNLLSYYTASLNALNKVLLQEQIKDKKREYKQNHTGSVKNCLISGRDNAALTGI